MHTLDTVYTPENVLNRSRFHLMSVIKNELQELVRELEKTRLQCKVN